MYLQMYKTSKRYTNSSSNLYFNLQNRQISESVCTSSIEFQFATYLFLVRIYKRTLHLTGSSNPIGSNNI